jgi:hypothetical protein
MLCFLVMSLQTTAATYSVCHFNGSAEWQNYTASTASADIGDANEGLSVFVILQTVCYWVVFIIGVVGNLLVLTLTVQLQSRKQVSYTLLQGLDARFVC